MSSGRFRLRRRGDRFFRPKGGPLGFAEFAGWLARGWLWLDGWFTSSSSDRVRVALELGGRDHQALAHRFRYSRTDLSALPAAGQILVLPLDAAPEPTSIDAVHLELDSDWYAWTGSRNLPIGPDLAFRLPERVNSFSPEIALAFRRFWLDRCVPAADDAGVDPAFELNSAAVERLIPPPPEEVDEEVEAELEAEVELEAEAELEEEVEEEADEEQEEPPACLADPGQPLGLSLEQVVAIDEDRVYLRGWWWDAEDVMEGLDLISPRRDETDSPPAHGEGEAPSADGGGEDSSGRDEGGAPPAAVGHPIDEAVVQTARPDVAELYRPRYGDRADGARGFFGLVTLPAPAQQHRGYRLGLRTAVGEVVEVGRRPPVRDPFAGREVVVSSLPEDRPPELALVRDHLAPALEPLQALCRRQTRVAGSFEFSSPPASPDISLLVPVYRRIDLLEHQIAHLAGDPDLADCELIYVLDSPELAAELEHTTFHLSRLFDVPLRGLVMARNVGSAGALNAAAAEARGRRLVLLHSDVCAEAPGWISRMVQFADSEPKVGVVGPKLLYEDRALQHAGIYFSRHRAADGLWSAVPLFKGLPERFAPAGATRQVPAVSGACLMIDRSLFERVGGLRDNYVAGDLEDADLCLRCRDEGYGSWYLPAATLFHVEGMSRLAGPGWRRNPWTELYNRYLFDRRWDERLRRITAEDPADS